MADASSPAAASSSSGGASGGMSSVREAMMAAVGASPSGPSVSPARRSTAAAGRSPLRGGTRPASGALWALATGVPEQSPGTRRVVAAQAAAVAHAQPAVAAAAEALLRSCTVAVAQEHKEATAAAAAAAAAASISSQGGSLLRARARRAATARLERKLLRDLDERHFTPLRDLPAHVNTDTHLQAQAYPGQVTRIRNVLETQPSMFKSVHAHVHANWKSATVEAAALERGGRELTEAEIVAAEIEAQQDDIETVQSYAVNQARARRAAAVRAASPTRGSALLAPSSAAAAAAAAAGSSATAAATSATVSEPASVRSYNRYASQRPSVVAEYRAFQREVAALPPRLNPAPMRHSPSTGTLVAQMHAQAQAQAQAQRTLGASASTPALRASDAEGHSTPSPTPSHAIDFAYSADAPDLHRALRDLPLPLASVRPDMFAFEYLPPVQIAARNRILTPRGSRLTPQSRGYSAAERVSLLVDGFRQEQRQQNQGRAWIAGMRQGYEEERRVRKTEQAKLVWARAVADEMAMAEADGAAPATDGAGAAAAVSASEGQSSDPFGADAAAAAAYAQKRRTPNAHLLSLPPSSSASSVTASPSPSMGGRHSSSQPALLQQARGSPSRRRSPQRPPAISTTKPSSAAAGAGGAAGGEPAPDTPSPTTPEGFWFTSKLALASYNRRKLEKELGLGPGGVPLPGGAAAAAAAAAASAAQHAYDSDDDEWLNGGASGDNSDDGGEHSGAEGGGGASSSRPDSASGTSASAAASAAAAASRAKKEHSEHMSRLLREVFTKAKSATAFRPGSGGVAYEPAFAARRKPKVLNAARFVMENPARRKARLARGESYARGNGFVSNHSASGAAAEGRAGGEAERHDAAEADEEAALAALASASDTPTAPLQKKKTVDPDAPMTYLPIDPPWLRVRQDYLEFLPRSPAFLALNSMQKPHSVRTAGEQRNIAQYLRTLPYLREYSNQPRLQSELTALARLRPGKKGEVLYKTGEVSTQFYILVAGSVRAVTRATPVELGLEPGAGAGAETARAGFRPNLPRLDTAGNGGGSGAGGTSVDFGGNGIRMLGPHGHARDPSITAPDADGDGDGDGEALASDGNGTFLSKRAQQMSPAKRAWSAARDRAARAQAAAVDDHGLSDPRSTVVLLTPGAVFGQSREAAVARQAEAEVKLALERGMSPARLRWRRIAEGVRLNKRLMSRYHAAAQELEGGSLGAGSSGAQRPPRHGSASAAPRPANSPSAKAAATRAHHHANPAIALARLRSETVLVASDDTLLIAISQADHDRVVQSSVDRHYFAQVVALKSMTLFQQPQQQTQPPQQQQKPSQRPKSTKASSSVAAAPVVSDSSTSSSRKGASLSAWRIKHLVQLVPHLETRRYAAGAVIAEEDSLGHHLFLLVSGSVTLWKDVELIVHTRLPAGPSQPVTVVETRKFRRVCVSTRFRSDSLAEECVAGSPKLDFTLKAGGGGCEVYALHRSRFLPFFRGARLGYLKGRVLAARSAAVNFLNGVVGDMLPGNAREQLGLSGVATASSSSSASGSAATAGAEEPRGHLLHVNMLEALAEDLRGDDDEDEARKQRAGGRSPHGHHRRRITRHVGAPGSPAHPTHPSGSGGSGSGSHHHHGELHASAQSFGSSVRTPARGGGDARETASFATPAPVPGLSGGGASASPTAALLATPSSLLQPGLPEHRPHSPAKYASATRLPCRIVTNVEQRSGGAAAAEADEAAAARVARVAGIFAAGVDLSAPAPGSADVARKITFQDEERPDASGPAPAAGAGGSVGLGATLAAPTRLARSGSARQLTAGAIASLTGPMLSSAGIQVAEADVKRIRAAQQQAQEAARVAAEARATAAAETAAATKAASPHKKTRTISSASAAAAMSPSSSTAASSPWTPSSGGSGAYSATTAATATAASSAVGQPHVNGASAGVKLGATTTITSRVLSRSDAAADEAATAPQVHVYFSLFTM